jgi:teichuronic acid biosynthesis glycosyltransferase TuaC
VNGVEPRSRLRGITFAKQYPNPAEPCRGLFVAEQVTATAGDVDWDVIAPVPWAPRWLAAALRKPYVNGDEVRDGVPVRHPRYPVLPRRLLYGTVASAVAAAARPAFREVVTTRRPQFVHVHALYPSAAAVRRLAAEHGLPYVVSIHGSDLYTNLSHSAARREVVAAVAGARRVICVSEGLAVDARRELGLAPDRVLVIPDTYDEDRFTLAARPAHDGARRLVTVGRLVDVKGFDVLIDALAVLSASGTPVSLEVVGAGPLESALRVRATAAGVAGAIRFSGALSPGALLDALREADVYVQPSRREGFGVALVEALATGLPAVATRCGGPADIVRAEDGVLVEPGDASALAAGLADVLERLAGFDPVRIAEGVRERFGRERVAARLVEVYRSALSEDGTRWTTEGGRP